MYSRILVPIDGSATAEFGLQEAIRLAAPLKSTVVLLTVVDEFPLMVEMASALAFDEVRRQLHKFGQDVLDAGQRRVTEAGVPCETLLRDVTSQRAAEAILEEAANRHCELIVMGTHGRRGISRLALGSDAEIVLRQASVPVLLVRNPHAKG